MTFYLYAWLASFLFGLIVIISKLGTKYVIANAWLFTFLWVLSSVIFNIPVAIANHATYPQQWTNLALAALFNGLGYAFYLLALYRLDISIISPLFSMRTAFSVILGVVFLQEMLTIPAVIFLLMIFIAGFFVSFDEKTKLKSFFQPAIGLALISMVFISLKVFFTNRALVEGEYWTVTLWINILSLVVLLPTITFFTKEIGKVSWKQLGIVALMGLLDMVGTLAANKAYTENIGISSAIISLPLSMVIAVVLSIIFPKLLEKHTPRVYLIRFTMAAIMIYAAIQLST